LRIGRSSSVVCRFSENKNAALVQATLVVAQRRRGAPGPRKQRVSTLQCAATHDHGIRENSEGEHGKLHRGIFYHNLDELQTTILPRIENGI
jgi:hypothetical protein